MSDNPFAEPDDDNRTIIRPNPGKRRQQQAETQAPTQAEPPSRREASAGRSAAVAEGTEKFSVGDDVLTAAAAPLLMYICMSLGFVGQYRLSRRGIGDITRIREETYAVIVRQQQKTVDPDLAPHTKGINAPYRPARFSVPLWVAAAAGLGVVGGLFLWFSISLNSASDTVYARLQGASP